MWELIRGREPNPAVAKHLQSMVSYNVGDGVHAKTTQADEVKKETEKRVASDELTVRELRSGQPQEFCEPTY